MIEELLKKLVEIGEAVLKWIRGEESYSNRFSIAADTATTDARIQVGPTKYIRVVDWPVGLTTLTIKIGRKDGPERVIDVLKHGDVIRLPQPVSDFYLTWAPDSVAETIDVVTGNVEVDTAREYGAGGVAPSGNGVFPVRVQGNAADGAAASGNPVPAAGLVETTQSTAQADGDVMTLRCDPNGVLLVHQVEGTSLAGGTFTHPASVSVTTSSTVILAAGSTRNGVALKNNGASACHLFFGATATTEGFVLDPGESIILSDSGIPAHKLAINGITASGTADVFIVHW